MDEEKIEEIKSNFPFISGLKHGEKSYIGIIQNSDEKVVTFYDLSSVKNDEDMKELLEHGENWWWASNRIIPINIFLNQEMKKFRYCLKTMNLKDTEVAFGPITSLNNILKKRIKRRQIQLVRNDDE